jgi:hypothetical protein
MIRDLSIIRKITIDEKKLATLKTNIQRIWDRRDLLAHGTWTNAPDGRLFVIKASGNWPKDLDTPVRSRRIMPEAFNVDVPALHSIVDGLDKTIESVRRLSDLIPLEAPPEEHPAQFAREGLPQGRKRKARQRPPESSPA